MNKTYNIVYLNSGKDYPIKQKQMWIFSGAIKKFPANFSNGEICQVRSSNDEILGYAYFNSKNSLSGRMLSFGDIDPFISIKLNIISALNLRFNLFNTQITNAFRLINGEADLIPGLVADLYNDVIVIQVSTLGIERIKEQVIEILIEVLSEFHAINISTVYEKSKLPSRKVEGLENLEQILWKNNKGFINTKFNSENSDFITEFKENGYKFELNPANSHKTGFYLDQREMRDFVGSISKDKAVLNCFSYTGGFSVYAAKSGAKKVTSVDISKEVIEQAQRNFRLNNLSIAEHEFIAQDVFKYLETIPNEEFKNFDIIVLDPPAFAKKRDDISAAKSGYKKLNRETIKKMKSGTVLITCSCSYHVSHEMFEEIVQNSVKEAGRKAKIIQRHRHAFDHPINIYHPEADYLKSITLWIE